MSDDTENMMSALAGTETNTASAVSEDWESKARALERELQTQKVEAGRLRKTNDELAEARKRIAELEGIERTNKAISDIPEEIGGDIPTGFKETSAYIAQRTVDQSMAGMEERMARMERQTLAGERNAFIAKVNAQFPGFLNSIGSGGDKQLAWNQYLKYNSATVRNAMESCDYDTLIYHIENFYRNSLGVSVPSGDREFAVPDPSANAGGSVGSSVEIAPGKIYSYAELDALYERIEEYRNREDYKSANAIDSEIKRAIAEGRVK